MKPARPIASEEPAGAWPVVASRMSPGDRISRRVAPVTHAYAALAFFVGGHARTEQNGEWTAREGDLVVVPAGVPHRMLETRSLDFWGLQVCTPCFAAGGDATLLDPIERVRDGASPVVHIAASRHAFLEGLFRELWETGADRQRPETRTAVQKSLLTLILAEVDCARGPTVPMRAGGGGVVGESLRFIERNCLQRLTVDDVARAVGRTPTYVTTALRRATGRSANEWIVSGRMAEARRLLLLSDEKLDVVAERVGYADATHFIRMFRRAHGATPAAWRSENREGVRVGIEASGGTKIREEATLAGYGHRSGRRRSRGEVPASGR